MISKEIEKYIKSYVDFPKEGIIFKDVMPILANPDVFKYLITTMAKDEILINAEAIIAIDSRGFLFGAPISIQLSKPLITARKPGKLPGHLLTKTYQLEYGYNSLSIQKNAIEKYNKFAIVDDLLATGGTVKCVGDLISSEDKEITGLSVVIELDKLKGRNKLNFPTSSIINF